MATQALCFEIDEISSSSSRYYSQATGMEDSYKWCQARSHSTCNQSLAVLSVSDKNSMNGLPLAVTGSTGQQDLIVDPNGKVSRVQSYFPGTGNCRRKSMDGYFW